MQARSLWSASIFIGLAALTRNDGMILYAAFLLIVLLVIKNEQLSLKHKLAASILPFAGLVLGYLLVYALVTGNFQVGTKERTWVAFMQGQYFIYPDDPDCLNTQLACALERGRGIIWDWGGEWLFNIESNREQSQRFADRLPRMLKRLPGMAYRALRRPDSIQPGDLRSFWYGSVVQN